MSHLVMIYSPDGEPFEVPAYKVGDLVLNGGWSQQKPEDAPVEEEVVAPARGRAKQTVFVEEEPVAEDESEEEDETDEEDE